jgi:hypothetical protein
MWLWESELHERGFRRRSERYWRCERGHGLPPGAHLSIFSWSEQALPGRRRRPRYLVELTEFHLTVAAGVEHVHFYYHERLANDWEPAGHTSRREVERLRLDLAALRGAADTVASALVEALGGRFYPRAGPP